MTALLELFWAFFQVGLFSIGGGYAALGVIQQQAVETYGWITQAEYLDLVTIAEMTPGPITLNSATFVGLRVGGLGGAVLATFASILPAIIIVSLLAYIYFTYGKMDMVQGVLAGLRPAVVGIIGAAALKIVTQALWKQMPLTVTLSQLPGQLMQVEFITLLLFLVSLIILARFKPNPVFVIIGCGIVGGAIFLVKDYVLI